MSLKDCPFCGETAVYRPTGATGGGAGAGQRVHIECGGCGVTTKKFGNVSDAQTSWNTRKDNALQM